MLGKQWMKRSGAALLAAVLLLSGTEPAAAQQTAGIVKAAAKEQTATAKAKIKYETYEKEYRLKSGEIYFAVYARYPVISGKTESTQRINRTLKEYADEMIREAGSMRKDEKETKKLYMDLDGYTQYSLDAQITYQQNGILSVLFSGSEYHLGTPHGFAYGRAFNFDMKTGELLCMEQILDMTKKEVRGLLKKKIKKQIRKEPDAFYENAKELVADCIKKAPENFYLTEEGLVYFFQLYDIAPYASGIQTVTVSLPEG